MNINVFNQKLVDEQLRVINIEVNTTATINAEKNRALAAENIIQNNVVLERERAVSVEFLLKQNDMNTTADIKIEQQRAILVEASLASTDKQIQIDFSNSVSLINVLSSTIFQNRLDSSNMINSLSSTIYQNRLDSSNAVYQNRLDSYQNRQDTSTTTFQLVTTIAQNKQDSSNAIIILKSDLSFAEQIIQEMNISQQKLNGRISVMTACAAVGLFADSISSQCIVKNSSLSSTVSSSSGGNICAGNSSSSVLSVKCFPGFSPTGSSAPLCAGSVDIYPTTFQCSGKLPPINYYTMTRI